MSGAEALRPDAVRRLPGRGARGAATLFLSSLFVTSAAAARAADTGLSVLRSSGRQGDAILPLTWGLLILGVVVVVVMAALVGGAILVRWRRGDAQAETRGIAVGGDGRALTWVYSGLALTAAILVVFVWWTISTLAAIDAPGDGPAMTVRIDGHQWWWEVRYAEADGSPGFETANEIHVPVGRPVRFELTTSDVIHTFWVPALGGKMDMIPGQTNQVWLQADRPGVYLGVCNEYCGVQHAHMAIRVIAQPEAEFDAWRKAHAAPAQTPAGAEAAAGQGDFMENCGGCHRVRGTRADGTLGPDLTHLASRQTLAAGMLPNTPENLADWIAHPQKIKPGNLMPDPGLAAGQLDRIHAYLLTLE